MKNIAQQAAQSPSELELLQRVLIMTRADRNQLFDALTESQVRAALLADDLAKAQARIKELEPKKPENEPKP